MIIFPELKNLKIFSKLNTYQRDLLKKSDFVFLLSLMIIDEKDNAEYFIYKYNLSKNDQKRIKIINNFFKEKINSNIFTENRMNKIFYYHGKQAVVDLLNFRILKSKKIDAKLVELSKLFQDKEIPSIPVGADLLMSKYKIPEGKILGKKLKLIEEEWVKNNFQISTKEIDNIIKN